MDVGGACPWQVLLCALLGGNLGHYCGYDDGSPIDYAILYAVETSRMSFM